MELSRNFCPGDLLTPVLYRKATPPIPLSGSYPSQRLSINSYSRPLSIGFER